MKAFQIQENDMGQRIDRFISKAVPALPSALLQRYIRLKRIKVNGKRCQNNQILAAGDSVELYINDEFFPSEVTQSYAFMQAKSQLDILYEDENILLLDKHPGLVVHEDDAGTVDTLINRVQKYLFEKSAFDPENEASFVPALCNRIDRNTGGIVIAAKNAAALRVMNQLIKDRLVQKYYLCIVHGQLPSNTGQLRHYLRKDATTNRVAVFERPVAEAKTAITHYRVLQWKPPYSLLEIELLTGRTHQIRAQMAHVGHSLLGDAKYGLAKQNKQSGYKFQALYAHRLVIEGGEQAGLLHYLNGKSFSVPCVWFMEDFEKGRI